MITQRLANKFPRWTRLRSDPSSNGWRFLSCFDEVFQTMYHERVLISDQNNLHTSYLPKDTIWWIDLEVDDQFPVETNASGQATYTYPLSVIGSTDGIDSYTVAYTDTLAELLYGPATNVTLEDTVATSDIQLWSSVTPTVFNTMAFSSQIVVEVSGSTHYYHKSSVRDRYSSDTYFVKITGTDINGIEVIEQINILDDGCYESLRMFSSVTDVEYEGFNGTVTLWLGWSGTSYKIDRFRPCVTQTVEGPMQLRVDAGTLQAFTVVNKIGWQYRTGIDVPDNEEVLFNLNFETGSLVCFAMHPETGLLYYVIDNGSTYHLYVADTYIPEWIAPVATATLDNYIVLLPLQSHVVYGATESLWTWFRQPRYDIRSVQVKRIAPDQTTEYLQANLSWGVGVYNHLGHTGTRPEETWTDLKFNTTYNQYGTWEYVCTVTTASDVTVYVLGVMVASIAGTDLGEVLGTTTTCWFNHDGDLYLWDTTNTRVYSLQRHTYMADTINQRIFFREDYSSVEVTY